jgi:uncharacterized membrane protein
LVEQDIRQTKVRGVQQLLDPKLLAALCYLPGFFFLPLLLARDDESARFHAAQSLTLFAALGLVALATWFVDILFGRVLANMVIAGFFFSALAWLLHYPVGIAAALLYVVGVIAGVVYAGAGAQRNLPFIRRYVPAVQRWLDLLVPPGPGVHLSD